MGNETVKPTPPVTLCSPIKKNVLSNATFHVTSPSLPPAVKKLRRTRQSESSKSKQIILNFELKN